MMVIQNIIQYKPACIFINSRQKLKYTKKSIEKTTFSKKCASCMEILLKLKCITNPLAELAEKLDIGL